MTKDARDVIDYCPFCGKKGCIERDGPHVVCTNPKCETEPFHIRGGVKRLDKERG